MQIGHWESLDLLPQRFDALLADENIEDYYSHPSWYRNFLATCLDPGDQAIFLGLSDDDGSAMALLPLRRLAPVAGPFGPRRIGGLSNFYTCNYQPLVKSGANIAQIANALAGGLCQQLAPFDILRLDSLPQQPNWTDHLRAGLGAAGFLTDSYFHFGNWYEDVEGMDYENYLGNRPSKLRNTLRRRERKLQAEGALSFRLHSGGADTGEGLAAYERVHENSWKVAEPYPDFAAGLVHHAATAGALRLGILYLSDRPIAAQIWLVANRRATIFKLSYDEAFKALSPGTVLTAWMVRQALQEENLREIDFGRGDDPYKSDWLSKRREHWGIVACNPRTPAGLAAAAHLWLPAKIKRLLGRD